MEKIDQREADKGWIGVDFDGTLAMYDGWKGADHLGAPVQVMVDRVRRWLAEGRKVRIVTARVAPSSTRPQPEQMKLLHNWVMEHIGVPLMITCVKDADMIELWDDRAVAVEPNTGRQLSPSRRGLG